MLALYIVNNMTGDVVHGNYDYSVAINQTFIAGGKVNGHQRDLGWEHLVIQIAQESLRNKTKKGERDA